MRTMRLALLAIIILLLAACRPVTREGATAGSSAGEEPASAATNALAETSWTLATLNGAQVAAAPVVALNLSGTGSATGTDGCNRFSISYTVDGDAITFAPSGASTMMACEESIMAQATAFITALTSAATFASDGATLTLFDGNGAELATFATVSSNLAGTSWTATSINNGNQAVVGVIEGSTLTANFGADGSLSGSGGCNNFRGSFESDGISQLTISPLASTMMACPEPEGVSQQEMQYLTALTTAATYTVEGNQLELRTADGALAVSFQYGVAEAAGSDAATATDVTAGTAGMASVTGTVVYLQRIALPPDAMVTVTINNASLADAPPEMTNLATTAFLTEGNQVPLPFELFYMEEDVMEGAMYSIGATIRSAAGELLFVSTEANLVITNGNPTTDVEILVTQP